MKINFTLGVDGDANQLIGLLTWLEENYHQVNLAITAPEFISDDQSEATAHAVAVETEFEARHLVADIMAYEDERRALAKEAEREATKPITYCVCSHTSWVHSDDHSCDITGCGCQEFMPVEVDWLRKPITLDEM
jgi:hypothetical protein